MDNIACTNTAAPAVVFVEDLDPVAGLDELLLLLEVVFGCVCKSS